MSVEDHPQAAREIVSTLSSMGARVESCKSAGEAKSILAYRPFDVVMSDQSLSDGLLGLDVIRYVADRWPQSGLVMYTARDDSGMRQSLQSLELCILKSLPAVGDWARLVAKVAAHQISDCSDGMEKFWWLKIPIPIREMFRRQFEILGADADYAANGAETRLMEAHRYHLVLTDLHMRVWTVWVD